jgi:CheY-like chemotaxis protein
MQLAQRIKASPPLQNAVLICLSSITDPLKPHDLRRDGFAAWVSKPVLPSQLYDVIVGSLSAGERSVVAATSLELAPKDPGLVGARVLLAEDNEVNRFVASELLRRAGCDCTIVPNGKEALEAAFAGDYDVVLMDCMMPEMDGFEATRQIRRAEESAGAPRMPIIALTANAIKGDRELCLAAGMDDYVTKPIDAPDLFRKIRSMLRHQAAAPPVDSAAAVPGSGSDGARWDSGPGPSTRPFDMEALLERCLGSREIAARALNLFDECLAKDLGLLAEGLLNGDAAAAAARAHAINGAASYVSASAIRRLAAELEHLAKHDAVSQIGDRLDRLRGEVDRFQNYLPSALAELAPGDAVVTNGTSE